MTRSEEIAHAREVDTEVARLYGLYHEVADKIKGQRDYIERQQKLALARYNQTPEAQAQYAARIASAEANIKFLQPDAKARMDAAWGFDADNYGGWTRFFLVQHIHNTMHCPSFRPTTRVGWLPNVSGLTAEEAVAEHGETLCTKCFPDAPVALTTKPADPAVCTGTRDREQPSRTGYYSGNWATCTCGARVTLTKTGALRKHKAVEEKS